MGRPSPERRQTKRKRQKVRRKLTYRTQSSSQMDQVDIETEPYDSQGGAKTTTADSYIGPIGGADTDLIEMGLYDVFREQDGEPHSLRYLMKCHKLLIAKVKKSNETISQLEKELEKIRLESKEENKRIRQYFEVVAHGHSRAGRMVRSALCSSPSAEKIIQELHKMYSSSNDSVDL